MATKRGLLIALVLFVGALMMYLMNQKPPGSETNKEVADYALPLAAPAQPTRLSALRGKVVILDFWSITCGPCKMSMPELEAIYQKYKDRGLQVIGISEDDPKAKQEVQMAMQKLGVTYPLAFADQIGALQISFPHRGIPALFLIDKQGKLVDSEEGYAPELMQKLDQTVEDLLAH